MFLRPCIHCLGDAVIRDLRTLKHHRHFWMVRCVACGGGMSSHGDKKELTDRWNNRPIWKYVETLEEKLGDFSEDGYLLGLASERLRTIHDNKMISSKELFRRIKAARKIYKKTGGVKFK